ncbi:hypothetical protein CBER1_11525 [Cercospora berteroae]|uniref:Uncharacterized protein n=1 Tax=Cercospora berteroae TaxID=357750 RepID=A0A2S6CH19_9PEZI|nr:hypothetical protein CBER1_11525 [Cercospora berteroae]
MRPDAPPFVPWPDPRQSVGLYPHQLQLFPGDPRNSLPPGYGMGPYQNDAFGRPLPPGQFQFNAVGNVTPNIQSSPALGSSGVKRLAEPSAYYKRKKSKKNKAYVPTSKSPGADAIAEFKQESGDDSDVGALSDKDYIKLAARFGTADKDDGLWYPGLPLDPVAAVAQIGDYSTKAKGLARAAKLPLYCAIGRITLGNLPPKGVRLDDYSVGALIELKMAGAFLRDDLMNSWPADFGSKDIVRSWRQPSGRPYVIKEAGRQYYAKAHGTRILCGAGRNIAIEIIAEGLDKRKVLLGD